MCINYTCIKSVVHIHYINIWNCSISRMCPWYICVINIEKFCTFQCMLIYMYFSMLALTCRWPELIGLAEEKWQEVQWMLIQYTFMLLDILRNTVAIVWDILSRVLKNSMQQKISEREDGHALTTTVCSHRDLMRDLHKPLRLPGRTMQHSLLNPIKSARTMAANFGHHHRGRMSYPANYIGVYRFALPRG